MQTIFDLEESSGSWASNVNEELEKDWPEYIEQYGKVGSEKWWTNYNSGLIEKLNKKGVITYVGEKPHSLSDIETEDLVEINMGGEEVGYSRIGHWKNPSIKVGANIEIESFDISIKQKYGPLIFTFTKCIKLANT